MDSTQNNRLNTQIYEQASEWFVEFRTGDPDEDQRKRFIAWLRTSPEHVRAYLELAAIWNEGPRLDPERRYDGSELTELASQTNVIPLERDPEIRRPPERNARFKDERRAFVRRRGFFAMAAGVLMALAGIGTWHYVHRSTYATGIGEQRSITLADGSRVDLNADSRIRESFSDQERRVELLRGQALFQVTRDPTRPFIVLSGDTQIRAVGTQFDVYRRRNGTTVTVIEGRVVVSPIGHVSAADVAVEAGENVLFLAAGEQAIVTAESAVKPERPNVQAATAWTQRRLVFEAAPLSEVAEEFNRHNRRPLVIRSPELRTFQITGIFSSTDPGALIRFLKARPDILVLEEEDEIIVSAAH